MRIRVPKALRHLFTDKLGTWRYRVDYGGRGSAKSHSYAAGVVFWAKMVPGLRVMCCREFQNSIKESSKRLIEDKIAEFGWGADFEIKQSEIVTPGGGLIVFVGLRNNADSIKSLEGFDLCWVEEAQTISARSLEILRPTLRLEASELWFTFNPRFASDPIDVMFRGPSGAPARSRVARVNFDDNPWFPSVLAEELAYDRIRDPDKYSHIWLGEYQRNSEARVFRNWTERWFEVPEGPREWLQGADWGFSVDPSVLIRSYVEGRTLYVCDEAYKVGCPIDRLPVLFDTVPGSRRSIIRADSNRPDTIEYMRRHGFPLMEPAIKGPNSIADGVEFLRTFDIVVHPSCRHTLDELALYSFKTDKHTNEVTSELADDDNHVIDALRYSVERLRHMARAAKRVPLVHMGR